MDIQRSAHEVFVERDADGWKAECVCGWKRFSITSGVITRQVELHMKSGRKEQK